MAYAMTKQGSLDNCVTYEFICDTVADMNAIENRYRTLGSIAIVLQGNGGMEAYIAGSDKQWNNLGTMGASSGSSSDESSDLSIHICAQNEVSNGLPSISEPDENTIYLVASGNTSGNLYEEYIYVDDAWEKFGAANIDLSGYAPIANPVFTGSINMGRRSSTTVGFSSVAEGYNATASGNYSHAEGQSTSAYGEGAHAEGRNIYSSQSTTYNGNTYNYGASGDGSHSEGTCTVAYEEDSHAEGSGTFALGMASHAEGTSTKATDMHAHAEGSLSIASGNCSHAEGSRTTASGSNAHSEGASTTASGIQSHAEGVGTVASGLCAHAEGTATIAAAADSHVSGKYNVADSHDNWPEWTANVSYSIGDKVKITTTSDDTTVVTAYICKIANNDSLFTESNWTKQYFSNMNYAEIIGNGSSDSTRSNARALGWDGNEYLMGDVYVGCNANSTGGTKLARIPNPPTMDGTYTLQAVVSNGTITYSWIEGA